MNTELIEAYARGGMMLQQALHGLRRADFLATPVPGTWSIQQIVLHLLDSDLVAADRMKRVIAEDNPTLIGFDESAFARNLFYETQDPWVAAQVFSLNRQLTADLLRHLPPAGFQRFGTHNERGRVTLGELVEMYVQHLEHHLRFLHQKRKLLGK